MLSDLTLYTQKTKGHKEFCKVLIMCIPLMASWVLTYVQTYQLHTLNVYSPLYINYTSVNVLK